MKKPNLPILFLEWAERGHWTKFENRVDGYHEMGGWYNTHNYAAMKQPLSSRELYELFIKESKKQPMKTASEIYKENGFTDEIMLPKHMVIMLMTKYGSQVVDRCAESAKAYKVGVGKSEWEPSVDQQSILNVKNELK